MTLFDKILESRGLIGEKRDIFLNPDYSSGHNPFLLPDMAKAVERLVLAHQNQEKITVYGDYDIDGLTATTVLLDAFDSFGFQNVDAYIPNRFVEGYGLTIEAVEKIARAGATLIITVDCGSLSEKEIIRAGELGVAVIVTDHHNVAKVQPPAVAVINPKRLLQDFPEAYDNLICTVSSSSTSSGTPARYLPQSCASSAGNAEPSEVKDEETHSAKTMSLYPFLDLPGVGVAFKLVQALQTKLDGLPGGQEKWLLDLVALGTVCDVVTLVDENRIHVYWGLKVLAKTRRPGLRALMAVSGVEPEKVNARSLGFALGPRMNASGRLETAQYALDLLRTTDESEALRLATRLDEMNVARRAEQDRIFEEAIEQAEQLIDNRVLVVSGKNWSHGIIGIVAAKLLEKYKKPTFVLEEMGEESKGSARSYGDFSAADAIRASDDIITKGGGHKLAAGVTLPTGNIDLFRERVNEFYDSLKLVDQQKLLLPVADIQANIGEVTEELVGEISSLEPFGSGNPEPILELCGVQVLAVRRMGSDGQHMKITVRDSPSILQLISFNTPPEYSCEIGDRVTIYFQPTINEWNGWKSIEGRLLHLELI